MSKNSGELTDLQTVRAAMLVVDYSSENEREIAAIQQAILPETRAKSRCALKTELKKYGRSNHLLLKFDSKDVVSLRASTNTNLRLVNSAVNSLRAVTDRKTG